MIQKVRRAQHRPISPHGNHQVDVRQVLPIQLDAIDARIGDVVGLEDRQEAFDALLVGMVA